MNSISPFSTLRLMRAGIATLFIVSIGLPAVAVEVDYGWMKGSNLPSQFGVPGTINVPAPANTPSARYGTAMWRDNSGGIWALGGYGYYTGGTGGYLNDLWFYDPGTGNWTWKSGNPAAEQAGVYGTPGVAAAGNTPGARSFSCTWTAKDGKLYLFGGQGSTGKFSDLWAYDPATGLWTWMRGSNLINQKGAVAVFGSPSAGNDPGARIIPAYTADSNGNFWLIGGLGYIPSDPIDGNIRDVWKYDPATNLWTVLRGPDRAAAVFGTQGVPSGSNDPGARGLAVAGIDLNNNIWYYGGTAFSDLWRYETATNTWTWMKGSLLTPNGSYGPKGVAAVGNTPSARQYHTGFSDKFGRFWIYGGSGRDSTNVSGIMGDLWMFDPASNNWAYMEGSTLKDTAPVFASFGSVTPAGDPGSRYFTASVVDSTGTPWIFEGVTTGLGVSNDLWKLRITENADLAVTMTAAPSIILGNTVTYTANVVNNGPDRADDAYLTVTLPAESIVGALTTTVGSVTESTGVVTAKLGVLGSGQTAAVTIVITPTIPTGTNATAQVGSLSFDPNTANNTATAPVNVIQGDGPDYVGDISGAQTCRTNRRGTQCNIKATATVVNSGNQNATVKSSLTVFLSDDNKLDPGDAPVKSAGVKKLRVGRAQSKRVQVRLPLNVSATGKFLILQVDSSSVVVEGNEFNNVKVFGPLP